MGDVVWNVDSQRRYLGLDGLDRRFRHVPALLLVTGQSGERDLYVCAGEAETAPGRQRERGGEAKPRT